jgi:hypothetical protein
MPFNTRWNKPPTGLDIPEWIFGFCRRIAASNVEPDLGSPEMKWMPLSIDQAALVGNQCHLAVTRKPTETGNLEATVNPPSSEGIQATQKLSALTSAEPVSAANCRLRQISYA